MNRNHNHHNEKRNVPVQEQQIRKVLFQKPQIRKQQVRTVLIQNPEATKTKQHVFSSRIKKQQTPKQQIRH